MTREEILQFECNHLRQQLEQVQNSRQTAEQRASEAEIEVRIPLIDLSRENAAQGGKLAF